jgi:uncharacterized protein (DUF1330 family)
MPKGYVYAEIDITDPEQYEKYRELAPASIATFGSARRPRDVGG